MEIINQPKPRKKEPEFKSLKAQLGTNQEPINLAKHFARLIGGNSTKGNLKIVVSNGRLKIYDLNEEDRRTLWLPPSKKKKVKNVMDRQEEHTSDDLIGSSDDSSDTNQVKGGVNG